MTVAELIEKLQALPQELDVYCPENALHNEDLDASDELQIKVRESSDGWVDNNGDAVGRHVVIY